MASSGTRENLDRLVRTLSHDMSANFMLLENSFSHLKKSLARLSQDEPGTSGEISGQVVHVDACLRESKRFLDDLDWLARTGGVEMQPGRVSTAAVVREVLFEQHELLAEHNVEVDVRRLLPVVWCNEARLKQVIANLIRNAVYHGCDPRRRRIIISSATPPAAAAKPRKVAMAAFQIHDNGPGIDRRFHGEVFRSGRRLLPERAAESGMGGSGMGLAIVKQIVEHYGGSVYVDPECRVGTALVVVLPEAEAKASSGSAEGEGPGWKLGLDARHSVSRKPRHAKLATSARRHRK